MSLDPAPDGTSDTVDLLVESVAVGGDGVGRDGSGRVVFACGALPGEQVRVRIESAQARFAKGVTTEVTTSSPSRVEPVCPHVARGCGGCGWAHVDPAAQRQLKVDMVVQALERLGRVDAPHAVPGPVLVLAGFRTTVRVAVRDGLAGFRTHHGHDRVVVDSCRVSHPLVEEMLAEGRFGRADEVTLRTGVATGERVALVSPKVDDEVRLPDDVVVVGVDELAAGRRVWFHEDVHGVRLRVSAESFFQSRPDGASALVDEVAAALDGADPDGSFADLYCGVGLFAAVLAEDRPVLAVERSRSSVADAQVNLAELDARVIRTALERWRPSPASVVVADPPRHGLARVGVEKVGATGATRLALVSCDAGSLGRDTRLLVEDGWHHERSTLVDMFGDTPHVEVVSRFSR